jgi:hypothetical protein
MPRERQRRTLEHHRHELVRRGELVALDAADLRAFGG